MRTVEQQISDYVNHPGLHAHEQRPCATCKTLVEVKPRSCVKYCSRSCRTHAYNHGGNG